MVEGIRPVKPECRSSPTGSTDPIATNMTNPIIAAAYHAAVAIFGWEAERRETGPCDGSGLPAHCCQNTGAFWTGGRRLSSTLGVADRELPIKIGKPYAYALTQMARLSKKILLRIVETALRDGGWGIARLSRPTEFPARYEITRGDIRHRIRVYIWNITHGGGKKRAPDEYRIQITSGVSEFLSEPQGKTLILGWSSASNAFAGWDLHYHSGPLGSSPSVQIKEQALQDAGARGFAVYRKDNGELAVEFQPEFIGTYVDQLEPLHAVGKLAKEAAILGRVATDPGAVDEAVITSGIAKPRRYAVITACRAL
jgi:Methylase-associated X1